MVFPTVVEWDDTATGGAGDLLPRQSAKREMQCSDRQDLIEENRVALLHVEDQTGWNASLFDLLKGMIDIFQASFLIDHLSFAGCM